MTKGGVAVPKLRCSLCGREEEVPKWHPEAAHAVRAEDVPAHVCATCHDRVRAEALRQQDPSQPPGGAT